MLSLKFGYPLNRGATKVGFHCISNFSNNREPDRGNVGCWNFYGRERRHVRWEDLRKKFKFHYFTYNKSKKISLRCNHKEASSFFQIFFSGLPLQHVFSFCDKQFRILCFRSHTCERLENCHHFAIQSSENQRKIHGKGTIH